MANLSNLSRRVKAGLDDNKKKYAGRALGKIKYLGAAKFFIRPPPLRISSGIALSQFTIS